MDSVRSRNKPRKRHPISLILGATHSPQLAHNGGGLQGPLWDRYGDSPNQLIESDPVYPLEPGLLGSRVWLHGHIKDVLVTENVTRYLGTQKKKLIHL